MKRFETPSDVADVLARHAPRHVSSLLDPSVGTGSLVLPLINRIKMNATSRFVVVDIDTKAIQATKKALTERSSITFDYICDDFLKWSARQKASQYDCVVMNPPFDARTNNWVPAPELIAHVKLLVPVEIAFLFQCINLLRSGGRMLAVVPATVVSGGNTSWVRRLLFEMGAVLFVRELPRSTFVGVESRFYLLIFEKGSKRRPITLCNHDIAGRERIVVPSGVAASEMRIDFAFYESKRCFESLRNYPLGNWKSISDVATVIRGKIQSPEGALRAIHTTDYNCGFWKMSSRHRAMRDDPVDARIIPGDILVKRVGRHSLSTFGQPIHADRLPFSDCVLCIRPKVPTTSEGLMFALRCLLTASSTWGVLERGSGASFLAKNTIERLQIPTELAKSFSQEFARYRRALRNMDYDKMLSVEKKVQLQIGLR